MFRRNIVPNKKAKSLNSVSEGVHKVHGHSKFFLDNLSTIVFTLYAMTLHKKLSFPLRISSVNVDLDVYFTIY